MSRNTAPPLLPCAMGTLRSSWSTLPLGLVAIALTLPSAIVTSPVGGPSTTNTGSPAFGSSVAMGIEGPVNPETRKRQRSSTSSVTSNVAECDSGPTFTTSCEPAGMPWHVVTIAPGFHRECEAERNGATGHRVAHDATRGPHRDQSGLPGGERLGRGWGRRLRRFHHGRWRGAACCCRRITK